MLCVLHIVYVLYGIIIEGGSYLRLTIEWIIEYSDVCAVLRSERNDMDLSN